jgi:hypothetical protein
MKQDYSTHPYTASICVTLVSDMQRTWNYAFIENVYFTVIRLLTVSNYRLGTKC